MYAFHIHEYVVWIIYFFNMSLIELNPHANEWLVAIEVLQERKRKAKKVAKKEEEKQMIVSNTPMFANCDGQDFKNHKSWS